MDNLVDLVKNLSVSSGLDASRLSNKDDENKLADPVGVTLTSDKCNAVGQKHHDLRAILVKKLKMSDQY